VLRGGVGSDLFLFRASGLAQAADLPGLTGDDPDAPLIEDFEPGADAIELVYEPAFEPAPGTPPALTLEPVEGATELRLNGALVAKVAGPFVPGAGDVRLVPA
jgi:hypothetical protein